MYSTIYVVWSFDKAMQSIWIEMKILYMIRALILIVFDFFATPLAQKGDS